jgi:hypothetical protein
MIELDCYIPIKHGIECKKVAHIGSGYLHQSYDDSPYDVDGMYYCGRCHTALGKVILDELENQIC